MSKPTPPRHLSALPFCPHRWIPISSSQTCKPDQRFNCCFSLAVSAVFVPADPPISTVMCTSRYFASILTGRQRTTARAIVINRNRTDAASNPHIHFPAAEGMIGLQAEAISVESTASAWSPFLALYVDNRPISRANRRNQ